MQPAFGSTQTGAPAHALPPPPLHPLPEPLGAAMKTARVDWRYRLTILSRTLAAALGGYALTAAFAGALSLTLAQAMPRVDAVLTAIGGDRFEERKPHPRQLLHCVEQYAQSKDQVLMIGDSSNDVEAARRAGIDCVVVSYGYNHGENILDCQPQQVVDNLCELIG